MDLATVVGGRIRAARRGRGWSLRQLGESAGLDFGYVGKVERGMSAAPVTTYALLTKALGITLSHLFEESVMRGKAPRKPTGRGRNARSAAQAPDIADRSRSRRHPQ